MLLYCNIMPVCFCGKTILIKQFESYVTYNINITGIMQHVFTVKEKTVKLIKFYAQLHKHLSNL